MKNEGVREAGKCSKKVLDPGDRCLFIFLCSRWFFFNIFPFPVCKAQLIGDWHENRWGGPKRSVRLFFNCPSMYCSTLVLAQEASVRQYIGAPMSPPPIGNADQAQWANNI